MKILFLFLFLFLTLFSCSEDEKDVCQDINCSYHGECLVKEFKAICNCNSNYHAENLECIKDSLNCGITEHEENKNCVSNTKIIDCLDSNLPENSTKIDSKVEITWHDGSWSDAPKCDFRCNNNFHKDGKICKANTLECEANQHEETGVCVNNTKIIDCLDSNLPENSTKIDSKVEITWQDGSWSNTPKCDFKCNEGYVKNINSCDLIVGYSFITPQLNEKLTNSSVIVSWNPPAGTVQDLWLDVGSEPYPSEARNNIKNLHLDNDFSVTTHTVTGLPEDGRVMFLSLSYKIENEWLSITRRIVAAGEPLSCEANQHEETGVCVANVKNVDCLDTNLPNNSTRIDSQVEITWHDGSWSEIPKCDFRCNEGYLRNGDLCNRIGGCETTNTTPLEGNNSSNAFFSKTLSPGETFIIDHKSINQVIDKGAIKISGQSGLNQTLIVRNSKFTNTNETIYVYGVDNVIIEGNLFDHVGYAMRIYKVKNLNVQYNKIRNFAVYPQIATSGWTTRNFCIVVESKLDSLNISNNLVDRSNDPGPQNSPDYHYVEDYLNLNHTEMNPGKNGIISNNYIMGSEVVSESRTGGGIIIDQEGRNITIKNNVLYNTAAYLYGSASSHDVKFLDNIGFITWEHSAIMFWGDHRDHASNAMIVSRFGGGTSSNIIMKGNRALAEVPNESDNAFSYYSNWFQDSFIDQGNNFTQGNSTGGSLSQPTRDEVLNLIMGEDRAGMFETHGTGNEYFCE